jgi:predicted ATPase/class 3 adenylate cyclase
MGANLVGRMHAAGLEASGQLRNVTVLFAEISGYSSLSDKFAEGDLQEFVQQYLHLMSLNVYKYEGFVDKLTGDGIMALFGAPISHENNAELAVRAALDMQNDIFQLNRELMERFQVEIHVRIGLHSGSVVVGSIGSNLMMDYTAIGDTVNLAQRIEEAAPPGTILVSEMVYRQVGAIFDCQQVSVLNPKGIAQPIKTYRVAGIKSRPGIIRGIEGLHAPMIGRDQELVRLKQVANRLVESRRGQFILVTGEAGLGKSRLTDELKSSIDPREIRILQGQSMAYRRTVPYWIIREVLFSYLGVAANAPTTQISDQLVRLVTRAMRLKAERALPFIENLLSIPFSDPIGEDLLKQLDPRQLRQLTFLAIRDLLVIESADRPLLIILDDLHWADEASLELISFIVHSISQAPIFLLAISRRSDIPILSEAAQWAGNNLDRNFEHIELQSLSRHQSERLLSLLLSIPDLPKKLREHILQRAAGIPFYLEEILRMLIDRGVIMQEAGTWQVTPNVDASSLGVPETLQELLLTRIDRLERPQKTVLRVAAMIGKDFSLPVLNGVLQEMETGELRAAIDQLAARDFIAPRSGTLEQEYTFKHILMSDAIYGTLLRRERQRLHGQVADVIERLYTDRLDEQVELLANHYRWSDRSERALYYSLLAGDKASRNSLNDQAYQHFKTALEILPRLQPETEQVYQAYAGMGDALAFKGEYPQAREHFRQAMQAIDEMGTSEYPRECSGLYRKIAKTFERQGDYEQALSQLSRAQATLDASSDPHPIEQAEVWNDFGWIHFRRGNFSEAGDIFQQALGLVEDANAYHVVASILNRLGGVAYYQGDWDQAAEYLRKSADIREDIGDVVGLASSSNNLGNLEIEMGEFDNALKDLERNLDLIKRLGQVEGIAVAYNNIGWLYTLRGELEEAKEALITALNMALQIGYSSLIRETTKNIGELYLVLEEWAQARQALTEVASAFEELGANDQLLHVYRMLGEVALGTGDLEKAQAWSQALDDVVATYGDDTLELPALHWGEILRFRGVLAMHNQEWETAKCLLQESLAVFRKLNSRLYMGRTQYQLGRLADSQGELQSASGYFSEAANLFQQIGAKLDERQTIAALEATKATH